MVAEYPSQEGPHHLLGKQECPHKDGDEGLGQPLPPTPPSHLPNQVRSVSLMLNIEFFSEKHQVLDLKNLEFCYLSGWQDTKKKTSEMRPKSSGLHFPSWTAEEFG